MLKEVMILSPHGPCFASRKYADDDGVDPQLFSALIVANAAVGDSEVMNRTLKDIYKNHPVRFFLHSSYNYISAAIMDGPVEHKRTKELLSRLNRMAYESLGNSENVTSLKEEQMKKLEENIDILVNSQGLLK